jgi:gliding motility-associated-like protein
VKVSNSIGDTIETFTGVTGAFIDSLTAGTYTLTIFGVVPERCANSVAVTIAGPSVTTPTATFTNPSYCGATDGTIRLMRLTPGVLVTINYQLNGIAQPSINRVAGTDSSTTLTGLIAGIYSNITVTYGRYCVSLPVGPLNLVNPPFTMRTLRSVNPEYCGICNGSITLFGLRPGQTDTINYTRAGVPQTPVVRFIGPDSQVVITGLCAGVYANFVARTSGVCVSNTLGPVTLTVPPFTMRALSATNPEYCGICNGSIVLYGLRPGQRDTISYTLGGFAQPPVVRLIGPDSTAIITGLCAGVYGNFVARTGGVCVSNTLGPVTLTVPPFTMRAISYTNPEYCGLCNGSIVLYGLYPGQRDTITYTLDGIPQPPVIRIIGPDSTAIITGLCPGVYANFVARTGGVCVSNTLGPVTLTVPPFVIRSLSGRNPDYCGTCNGTITVNGLYPGTTDTISYLRDGVAQPPVAALVGADSQLVIRGLCQGVYTDFVARTGGVCVSNLLGPITLTVPPFTMRTVRSTNPEYCGICNGTITLYGLYPGQTDTISYTLDGVAQPPIVRLIGADSQVVLVGMCAGVYDNFVARTGGICVSNTLGPVTLTVPPFTMRAIGYTEPDYCGICNGTITLYGLHPGNLDTISYTKDGVPQTPVIRLIGADSQVVITGLCHGVYANFVARTGGNCVSNTLGPVTLTVPEFTVRGLGFTNPEFCGICNGTITIYGLHPGNLDTISYTINGVAQPPIISLIPADSMVRMTGLCFGLFDNFVVRTGGTCVTDTIGPANLVVPPFTMRKIGFSNPTKCGFCDGVIKLFGLYPGQTDTISYSLNGVAQPPISVLIGLDSQVVMTGLCEGVYNDFTARTGGVCVSNTLGPVNLVAPPIVPGYNFNIVKTCKADTVYFSNTSAPATDLTYVWDFGDSTGTTTVTNPVHIYTTPGVYAVKLYITNTRCTDSITQFMVIDNLISAGFTASPDSFLCQGKPVTFTNTTVGTAVNYTWFFGDGGIDTNKNVTHVYKKAGVYNVLLTMYNYVPCFDTVRKVFEVDSISAISLKLTDSVLCGGHDVTFTGQFSNLGGEGWLWTISDGTNMVNRNPLVHGFDKPGLYTVTLQAFYRACPDTSVQRTVLVIDHPSLYLGDDTAICPGGVPIKLVDYANESNKRARWLWNTGATTPQISVGAPGYYSVTVNIGGCQASDTVWVKNDCYMNIPNVFSPNGDGVNDYFFPRQFLTSGLSTFKMEIYNRWGQLIFESTNLEGRGWDGTFNGVAQPEGVFVFLISATFKDGQIERHQGNVTLIR